MSPPARRCSLVAAVDLLLPRARRRRMVARREARAPTAEEAEVHVGPTIWPFGFAIAAVLIALGLVVSPWILILGAIAFVAAPRDGCAT